ncbi:type II secretion system protein [Candidatus Saccharibacteria bacterium]|nr:type II secretion system protein [Candidatus Saccharibacteria bacterium]
MKKTRGGFTLIEMALSLAFIGILSVMIVVLIQNTTSSYRRGLILNQLNTVGMDLIDDIRSSVQGASTDSLKKLCQRIYPPDYDDLGDCLGDNANSFSIVTKYGEVKLQNDGGTEQSIGTMPVYGAFCTGTYTYIWNSGYFDEGQFAQGYKVYKLGSTDRLYSATLVDTDGVSIGTNFRLLKIYDRERTICRNANGAQSSVSAFGSTGPYTFIKEPGEGTFTGYNNNVPTTFVINSTMLSGSVNSDKNNEGGVELLKRNSVNDLVIYDFYMTRPAMSETRQNLFFAGSFVLGTRRGGVDIKAGGNSCRPPSDEYSDLEYCAINKFNFAVQAGGE